MTTSCERSTSRFLWLPPKCGGCTSTRFGGGGGGASRSGFAGFLHRSSNQHWQLFRSRVTRGSTRCGTVVPLISLFPVATPVARPLGTAVPPMALPMAPVAAPVAPPIAAPPSPGTAHFCSRGPAVLPPSPPFVTEGVSAESGDRSCRAVGLAQLVGRRGMAIYLTYVLGNPSCR
jgi:hypothetical protein